MMFYMMQKGSSRDHTPIFHAVEPWLGCNRYECNVCGQIGLKPARCDLAVKVDEVEVLDDIEQVLTSTVVSRRFRNAVLGAGLTGMDFRKAVKWEPAEPTPELIEFTRRCCATEYEVIWAHGSASIARTCGLKIRKSCDHCGWVSWTVPEGGILIDEAEWDGKDFFQLIELPGPVFMTQRAVDVLSQAGLSNFGYRRAEDHYPRGRR